MLSGWRNLPGPPATAPMLCVCDIIALLFVHLYETIWYAVVRKHQSGPPLMRGFDWNDLKYFLTIARAGKLTTAARQLDVDHTTVSRRIGALEENLRATLFERSPQGYKLTQAGERLMAHA